MYGRVMKKDLKKEYFIKLVLVNFHPAIGCIKGKYTLCKKPANKQYIQKNSRQLPFPW